MNTHHPLFYFTISCTTFHFYIPAFPTMSRELLPCTLKRVSTQKQTQLPNEGLGFFSIIPCFDRGNFFLTDTLSSLNPALANLHLPDEARAFLFLQTVEEGRKKRMQPQSFLAVLLSGVPASNKAFEQGVGRTLVTMVSCQCYPHPPDTPSCLRPKPLQL